MENDEVKNIINRTKLLHILKIAFKRHMRSNFDSKMKLFNWPINVSVILTVFTFPTLSSKKISMIHSSLIDIVSLSISSLSIVLAAFAIIFVIYNKDQLKKVLFDPDAFEGFISPYILGAMIWCVLAIFSFFLYILNPSASQLITKILYILMIFLLYYGSLFMIYILIEILQHMMLSIMH